MPKKKEPERPIGSIRAMTLEDVMEDRFAAYAKDIIQDRALPDARDGLKPAQRRIIYSMFLDGNTYNKPTRKSAKTVGNVIGTLHPHGDSSVYEAMVRMSQDWKMRVPLVEMQGNNGSIDDDPPAAMRYTEARLSRASELLTQDLDKDTVEWAPNYDDTMEEPTVLPARFPNLLVNGAKGIAEGYSTEIAPHNLGEICQGCIQLIRHPHTTLDEMMEIIPGPDFPTGGIVQGKEGIRQAFETGRGSIIVRSKVQIVKTSRVNQLVITEIPYDVVKHDLIRRINKVRFDKEINGINDVIDETDLSGLKIVVDLKSDVDAQLVLNYLFKKTSLQTTYSYNMVAIVERAPRQMGLMELLQAFLDHRREVILRRTRHDLQKMSSRCHIIEGLIKAVSILDEVIDLIRHSHDKADSKKNLMARFGFTEPQAEAIVMMQLYRLSNTDITALEQEYSRLQKQMEQLQDILDNESSLNRVMVDELKEIQKEFPSLRRTQIEDKVDEIVIDKSQMISHEDVMVAVSRDGYIKRCSMRSFQASGTQLTGIKDSDQIAGIGQADTGTTLMAFTDQGNYLCIPVFSLDEFKWKDLGVHVNKFVAMNNAEKIVDALFVPDFHTAARIISVTRRGRIKSSPINIWELQRCSRTSLAIKMAPEDAVVRTFVAYEEDEVLLVSKKGYMVRYPVSEIPSNKLHSTGVSAMNLEKGDRIGYADRVAPDDTDLVVITESAQSKRIKLSEVHPLRRPARGELAAKLNKTHPAVIRYAFAGKIDSTFDLVTDQVKTMALKDVTLMSRESTFTMPIVDADFWFLSRTIETVEKREEPKEPQQIRAHDGYEQIQFEVDES